MRGRIDIAAARTMTAELRVRLAENNECSPGLDAGTPGAGRSLGEIALRRAHLATAVHMHAAAAKRASSDAHGGDER